MLYAAFDFYKTFSGYRGALQIQQADKLGLPNSFSDSDFPDIFANAPIVALFYLLFQQYHLPI